MNEAVACDRPNDKIVPQTFMQLAERIFVSAPASRRQILDRLGPEVDLSFVTAAFVYWLLTVPDGARRFSTAEGLRIIDRVAALYQRRLRGEAVASEEWALAEKEAKDTGESLPDEATAAYETMIMAQAAADDPCTLAWMAADAWASATACAAEPETAQTQEDMAKADGAYKAAYQRMACRIIELLTQSNPASLRRAIV